MYELHTVTIVLCCIIFRFIFQLKREPRPFPQFHFKRKISNIDDFKFSDFTIDGYKPHGKIAMEMAV